jgi:prevent-host-death family protein
MKLVAARKARQEFAHFLEASQRDAVVVMKHGHPESVVIGVRGDDLSDLALRLSPSFWRMIEARRAGPHDTFTYEEAVARFNLGQRKIARRRAKGGTSRR